MKHLSFLTSLSLISKEDYRINTQINIDQQEVLLNEFSFNNTSIRYEIENNNIKISVEDCAYALGVTKSKRLKDNSISTTVRWDRVYNDLVCANVLSNDGAYKSIRNDKKILLRNKLKVMKITQEEAIIWSKNVNNNNANYFIQILSQMNSVNINNIIIKEYASRNEIEFFKLLNPVIKSMGYEIINQYKVLNYKLDGYIPELNLAY